ncbi:MAG: hypothetical protein HEP71_26785 [Roseivirga sp.]|nr:hypothetical protein [Roseivirga sp.]
MKQAISRFLKAALVLTLFLLTVSIVYVAKTPEELDADSMLLAMLLLAFSGIASLIIGAILVKMRRS